ncbi:MAG: HyfI [uncultured bacterium]|nr:MAG: HyfI [uncultured bacterium]
MFEVIRARFHQKYRTIAFPETNPVLPERYRGCPKFDAAKCNDCKACLEVCPTNAIMLQNKKLNIDLGKCIFCLECMKTCKNKVISFTNEFAMAVRSRNDLMFEGSELKLAKELKDEMKRIFGRSLKLRQVSAGGCNACEADVNVLSTVVFDLSRFGIQFVASPRHADGLLITGPVTANMKLALKKTYEALTSPKLVIACGACAISGGVYEGHKEVNNGVEPILPVDLFIPGCPPHPMTILDGLLRLLGRIKK